MSDSDSSLEEARQPNRRRKIATQKNLPRKKAKESPLTDSNVQLGKRTRKPANQKVMSSEEEEEEDNLSDSIEASSGGDSIENHPPSKGSKKKNEVARNSGEQARNVADDEGNEGEALGENDDEAEKRMRQRRRLSRSFRAGGGSLNNSMNTSVVSESAPVVVPDRAGLRSIYSNCVELFQAHKITQKNAFNLKLLDCLDAIINGPDFNKDDMHMVGRTLEVGTRIYVCRVEHTHSEVMHLASDITVHNNKLKERNKNLAGEEGEEGEFEDNNDDDDGSEQRVKAGKKKKRGRFIEDDDSKLCTDFEGQSTKYVTRRVTLKKKFTRMINEEIDFDYLSNFITPDAPHPLTIDNEHNEGDAAVELPSSVINAEEIKRLNFLDFNLLTNFDPTLFDVWGKPLADTDASVTENQQGDVIQAVDDFVYDPETRPQEYVDDLDDDRGDDDFRELSHHFANEGGDGRLDISKPIPVHSISSLDQLNHYFAAIKNIHQMTKARYGWAGPQFFQPRRNWIRPLGENKPKKAGRKKKEIEDITFEKVDWKDDENKYISTSKERTVLDERTIEKWSFTKTSVPYMGIENNEWGEEDDLTDAFANVAVEDEDAEDYVHPLLRFFVDPKRNIECLLKKEIAKYGTIRDAGDFANDRGEFPDDSYIQCEDAELSARDNENSYCASNGLLNGEPIGNDIGPAAENDDPLATLAGLFPTSMGLNFEDDFITKATDATDSIKFTKKPKPVDMHALKSSVLRILTEKLEMNAKGEPSCDEDKSTTLFELLEKVFRNATKKVVENLSIPIVVVALMHVVADRKLFMMPGKTGDMDNPFIVCRGKLWKHEDHVPKGPPVPFDDDEDDNNINMM